MSTSEYVQGLSAPAPSAQRSDSGLSKEATRPLQGVSKHWMAIDAITVMAAAVLTTAYVMHTQTASGTSSFWRRALVIERPTWALLALLCWFVAALIVTGTRLHLYTPLRVGSVLHEQWLSAQSCLTSGLMLTGTLYLIRAEDIPRRLVLLTIGVAAVLLSLRRLVNRILLHRRYKRGIGTRKVLIVGTGPKAHALRHHLERAPHLGYTVNGFIETSTISSSWSGTADEADLIEAVFQDARRHFVNEIFFTSPFDRCLMPNILEQARAYGVDVRVAPEMYDNAEWSRSIEYIDRFPTLLLHSVRLPEWGLLLKRAFDLVFSSAVLIMISPLLLAIAIAIKLESPGPVLYRSARIGKKGRVFDCLKFRTMVRDAEERRAEIEHLNERDGVLFKVANDPRITRLGRFLRKYSLDELPQFVNVLRGEMSVVGPRPPLAAEVAEYDLSQLRRLDVIPGITGLWQVEGRLDPSFACYVSLDRTYIETWNLRLDFKIIIRTIGVIFAGTGS